jgi:uncharacterized membrane protein YczE
VQPHGARNGHLGRDLLNLVKSLLGVVSDRAIWALLLSCIALGVGVAMLLRAGLGSDGYSTLINGLSLATGAPFVLVNLLVGVVLVAMAWVRGPRPGLGTVVQPVVVGFAVSAAMGVIPAPDDLALRPLVGWLLGGAIGPGTLLVILLLGPAVDLLSRHFALFDIHAFGEPAHLRREPDPC